MCAVLDVWTHAIHDLHERAGHGEAQVFVDFELESLARACVEKVPRVRHSDVSGSSCQVGYPRGGSCSLASRIVFSRQEYPSCSTLLITSPRASVNTAATLAL